MIELSEVNDKTFASGVIGKGMAVVPSNGDLYAPVDGVVSMIFPTQHALGFTTDDGKEILVHIGLETVDLNGEGFNLEIKTGQRVKCGERIGSFDLGLLKEKAMILQLSWLRHIMTVRLQRRQRGK